MDFRVKCLIQSIFSAVPKGELLNYVFQKYISKSLPPQNPEFLTKVGEALSHLRNFEDFNTLENNENKYYEFGAGWTLIIPLVVSMHGFEVSCIDIRKLIVEELINQTLRQFENNAVNLPFKIDSKLQEVNKRTENSLLSQLKKELNFNYFAPVDARNTKYEKNTFDFMSSTATLEHLPVSEIKPILFECHRILKPGGILSMIIDYQDHWSYFDRSISVYNFLKYDNKEWKRYNPSLHFQNRLRHSDYINIINSTGFTIVKEFPYLPTEENLDELASIKVSDSYSQYKNDDLLIKGCEIVLRKD